MSSKLELKVDEAGRGTVRFNGKPIKVRKIEILAGVGMVTSVILEIVDIEVKAITEGVMPLVDDTPTTAVCRHYRMLAEKA